MARSLPTDTTPPLETLRQRIDRLLAEFGHDFQAPATEAGSFGFVPDAERHDGEREVTIRLELPGVEPKDTQITVTDRTIEVSGEKKADTEHRAGDYIRSERSFGAFHRDFTLPFTVVAENVDARFDKGVLVIRIPKPAETRHAQRKIPIRG